VIREIGRWSWNLSLGYIEVEFVTCMYSLRVTLPLAPTILSFHRISVTRQIQFFPFFCLFLSFIFKGFVHDVGWWEKSDGFPLIFCFDKICEIMSSYFWQHHAYFLFVILFRFRLSDDRSNWGRWCKKYLLLLMVIGKQSHLMIPFHRDLWGTPFLIIIKANF